MPWLALSKPVVIVIAIAGLLALAGAGFWRGMARIDALTVAAADGARKERDAHWQAEIEKANAATERARSDQAVRAAMLEAAAAAASERAASMETELEKANAALPNAAACGLDRDRGRLLNGSAP